MDIEIERGNTTAQVKTGFFSSRQFTTHDVRLTVDFAEEEKAIIVQSGLAEYVFYECPPDPILTGGDPKFVAQWSETALGRIQVGALLRGPIIFHYENLVLANKGEADLGVALRNLKGAMASGGPPEQKKRKITL